MISKREYKALKYLRVERTGAEIAAQLGPSAVQTATDLVEQGFAHQFSNTDASFLISCAGANAMRDYRAERRQRFVSAWLAPIVVGIILTGIALVLQFER